jgi:O-antigen/teichoic acid export membrane protein
MTLLRTSFYTSISHGLTILAGLISIKVVSVKIGPEGMAMVGQYLNTTALLALFATGAIGSGVVKYLAQYHEDKTKQLDVIRTAFWVTVICSLIVGLSGIAFSFYLSKASFKTGSYFGVYIFWGSFLIFTSLAAFMSNVLNGLKLIPYLTLVNVSGTIAGLLITVFLAYKYGVYGVLIAANFTSFILFSIHLFFFKKYKWFSLRELFGRIDPKIIKLLTGFIMMALVSGILVPSIQLLVRDRLITKFSFEQAGYWQSVTRISDYYLGFITTVIGVYYLPRLSEIKSNAEIRTEIWKMYKIILPIVAGLSVLIWLFRFVIIRLVLTKEFLPSAPLFSYQFIGDFFKIASWLLGYVMLARAMKYKFIVTEIFFSVSYVLLCYFFIDRYGLIGSTYGFLLNNILLWLAMLLFIKRYIR